MDEHVQQNAISVGGTLIGATLAWIAAWKAAGRQAQATTEAADRQIQAQIARDAAASRREWRKARVQRFLENAKLRPARYGQLLTAARSSNQMAGPSQNMDTMNGDETLATDQLLITLDDVTCRQAAEAVVSADQRALEQCTRAYRGKGTAVRRDDIAEEIAEFERALRAFDSNVETYVSRE